MKVLRKTSDDTVSRRKKTSAGDIFEESRIYIEYACVFILSQITQILADKRQVGEMKLTTITAVLAEIVGNKGKTASIAHVISES